jgi:hypothetical protein
MLYILCSITTIYSYNTQISLNAVERQSKKIKLMITRNQYIVNGLALVGIMQQVTMFASMIFSPDVAPAVARSEKEHTGGTGVKSWALSLCSSTYSLLTTKQGWLAIAQQGWSLTGYFATCFILNNIAHKLEHPNTLRWYNATHAPYMRITSMIKQYIDKMADRQEDVKALRHYTESLRIACYQLVFYGESICAYMAYKSTLLDGPQQELAEKNIRYCIEYQNDIFRQIFNFFDRQPASYEQLTHLITEYEIEMKEQCAYFSAIERESKVDYLSIGPT